MRTNGVEVVMLGVDSVLTGPSFVSTADGQNYRPGYAAGDPWAWSTDFVVSGMPASFDGALTVTAMRTYDWRVGVPEPAKDAQCREIVERRTDFTLNREGDEDALYVGSMWACGVMDRLRLGAELVGPDLTRPAFAAAMGQLGTIEVPYSGGFGTYAADKLDGLFHFLDFTPPTVERDALLAAMQDEGGVNRPRQPGGARNHVERVVPLHFAQVVDDEDRHTHLTGHFLQRRQGRIIGVIALAPRLWPHTGECVDNDEFRAVCLNPVAQVVN